MGTLIQSKVPPGATNSSLPAQPAVVADLFDYLDAFKDPLGARPA